MPQVETTSTISSEGVMEWKLRQSVSIHELRTNHFAVRDLATRTYFQVGGQEALLLQLLLKGCTFEQAKLEFQHKFSEVLTVNDFEDFIELLAAKNLLVDPRQFAKSPRKNTSEDSSIFDDEEEDEDFGPRKTGRKGNILFYRVPIVNPNRFLGWFVKTFPFFWSSWFISGATALMILSLGIVIGNASQLFAGLQAAARWETVLIGMVVVLISTAIHEIGHGATCKRFGGEVMEAGFLLMFFMPCLYVNVSDAWIIREKWKRLAITAAGGYCDLLLWAIGVIVWRITQQDTTVNYLSFLLLTACGARSLLNFNPLIRLDGYYLVCDILGYPNLYRQSRGYWIGTLNWLLWGASKPKPPARPKFTLMYGMMMWFFGLWFLAVVGWQLLYLAKIEIGVFGVISVGCFLMYGIGRVFRGFLGRELIQMLTKRFVRFLVMTAVVAAIVVGSFFIPLEHASVGNFEVRPSRDVDLCSPLHSFIASVYVQDGQHVEVDEKIVELYAPELASAIIAKEAEMAQSRANLAKLEAGPRKEEISILEDRVKQLTEWYKLGERELSSAQIALEYQLQSLSEKTKQVSLQIALAEKVLAKSQELFKRGAVTGSQIVVEESQLAVLRSLFAENELEYSNRKEEGVRASTAELARRQQELTSLESQLKVLKLGYRIEEIEAERSRTAKLDEEHRFLVQQRKQLVVRSTTAGVISAPRLREKVGQFVPLGSPICRIEQFGSPKVELFIPEDEAVAVKPGQSVRLKARALPFETIMAVVERISPATTQPKETNQAIANQAPPSRPSLVVHCHIESTEDRLRSGMTGFGRVDCGKRSAGYIVATTIYKYIRTEFWW